MPFQEPFCDGSETLVNVCTHVSLGDIPLNSVPFVQMYTILCVCVCLQACEQLCLLCGETSTVCVFSAKMASFSIVFLGG